MKINRKREIVFNEDFAVHSKGDKVILSYRLSGELVNEGVAKFVNKDEPVKTEKTVSKPIEAKAKAKKTSK